MDSIPVCWKFEILPRRAFVLPKGKKFVPCADCFFVLIKPLFCLPQNGKRKWAESDGVSRNAPYGYGLAELQKILEMGVGVLIRLATEWASLHHVYEAGLQLKVHVYNINVGCSCGESSQP